MHKRFGIANIVILAIGIAYVFLAFTLIETEKDCKECEESKKNFIPVEVPSNDGGEE